MTRLRNATAKVVVRDQDCFRFDSWQVFEHIEEPQGQPAADECRRRIQGFRANWEKACPGRFRVSWRTSNRSRCTSGSWPSTGVVVRHTNLILVNRPMEAQLAEAA